MNAEQATMLPLPKIIMQTISNSLFTPAFESLFKMVKNGCEMTIQRATSTSVHQIIIPRKVVSLKLGHSCLILFVLMEACNRRTPAFPICRHVLSYNCPIGKLSTGRIFSLCFSQISRPLADETSSKIQSWSNQSVLGGGSFISGPTKGAIVQTISNQPFYMPGCIMLKDQQQTCAQKAFIRDVFAFQTNRFGKSEKVKEFSRGHICWHSLSGLDWYSLWNANLNN